MCYVHICISETVLWCRIQKLLCEIFDAEVGYDMSNGQPHRDAI